MKNRTTIAVLLMAACLAAPAMAQPVNWNSARDQQDHMIHVHAGMEYGVIYGLGYSYRIGNWRFPVLAGAEFSIPSGPEVFDDFKARIGGQVRWVEFHHVQFSTRIQGVFRRYENDLVRMLNFGSDLAGVLGYYRPRWFVAGEAGFDKAIVTHFRHSQQYVDQYADVVDGWYEPPAGGNFYYGIQAGYSFRKSDIYAKAGNVVTQDFKTSPMLPVYTQLGCTIRL